jgi:NLI interacting factor-like phosphatase
MLRGLKSFFELIIYTRLSLEVINEIMEATGIESEQCFFEFIVPGQYTVECDSGYGRKDMRLFVGDTRRAEEVIMVQSSGIESLGCREWVVPVTEYKGDEGDK